MSENKIDSIKDKLKKLIAKEASAREVGNQAEADAFASKIQQLLLEYELEIDEVLGSSRIFEIGWERFDCETLTNRHESDWITFMYASCAKACFCKVLKYTKGMDILIYGEDANRELLHYMVAQLSVKLRHLARKSFSQYDGSSKRNTYFRSFYRGAAIALGRRLAEDSIAQAQQYGIVLDRDRKLNDYIKQWAQQRNVKIGRGGPAKMGSSTDGFFNGMEAGKSVGINKGVNHNYQAPKQLN